MPLYLFPKERPIQWLISLWNGENQIFLGRDRKCSSEHQPPQSPFYDTPIGDDPKCGGSTLTHNVLITLSSLCTTWKKKTPRRKSTGNFVLFLYTILRSDCVWHHRLTPSKTWNKDKIYPHILYSAQQAIIFKIWVSFFDFF